MDDAPAGYLLALAWVASLNSRVMFHLNSLPRWWHTRAAQPAPLQHDRQRHGGPLWPGPSARGGARHGFRDEDASIGAHADVPSSRTIVPVAATRSRARFARRCAIGIGRPWTR